MHEPRRHGELATVADDSKPLTGRKTLCVALLFLVWTVIAGRLIQVQWLQRTEFAASATRQRTLTEVLPPRPGEITDRNGLVLAASVRTQSLWVNPSRIPNLRETAVQLAAALNLDADRLADRLAVQKARKFVWVKRRLTGEEGKAVRKLELPADAAGFREEYRRHYPQGALAAHLIGLRDIDGRGQGGVEQMFDRVIRGRSGSRTVMCDARGRVLEVLDARAKPPVNGQSVQLTIDSVLQIDVEAEIDALMNQWKPMGAGIIVMNPQTGELLAMASRPAFDPNAPANVEDRAWKNVNVASVFEPGSTFKPFVLAWALEKDVIRRDEQFHCEWGKYRMGRRLLHDHHPYGSLSVKDILVKSSNIGMAKIGERLTNRGLYQAAVRFGFGQRTGSGLPGELDGILRPLHQWNDYSTGSIPMGQELAVTPLQLITAHAALANGGKLISPRLVRKIGSDSTSIGTPPRVVSGTVRPDIAAWVVREAMTDVVRRGTGKRAQLPGYDVFGKTGTAQKIDPKTGKYSPNRHVCSFLCGAPAANPRVLVLVVVDEPTTPGVHYGGTVAAPTAARVLKKSLIRFHVPSRVADQRGAPPGR